MANGKLFSFENVNIRLIIITKLALNHRELSSFYPGISNKENNIQDNQHPTFMMDIIQ